MQVQELVKDMENNGYELMDTTEMKTIGKYQYISTPDYSLSSKGNVHRGSIIERGKRVVIKIENIEEYEEMKLLLDREVDAADASDKITNVIEILDKIDYGPDRYIVYKDFDYTLENLYDYDIPVKQVLKTATKGLMHYHEKFIHRNINPENIVIRKENDEFMGFISDLSMSKLHSNGEATISRDWSSNYSAPELMNQQKGGKVTKAVDVFSIGLVYFYGLTKFYIFEDPNNITNSKFYSKLNFNTLKRSKFLKRWEVPFAMQLTKAMIQYDSKNRPNLNQVYSHPLFSFNFEKIEKFLCNATEYIGGKENKEKQEQIAKKFGSKYEKWQSVLSKGGIYDRSWINISQTGFDKLLIYCRNFLSHTGKAVNEGQYKIVENYEGKHIGYVMHLLPDLFFDLYMYFKRFSNAFALKEFYCDYDWK